MNNIQSHFLVNKKTISYIHGKSPILKKTCVSGCWKTPQSLVTKYYLIWGSERQYVKLFNARVRPKHDNRRWQQGLVRSVTHVAWRTSLRTTDISINYWLFIFIISMMVLTTTECIIIINEPWQQELFLFLTLSAVHEPFHFWPLLYTSYTALQLFPTKHTSSLCNYLL